MHTSCWEQQQAHGPWSYSPELFCLGSPDPMCGKKHHCKNTAPQRAQSAVDGIPVVPRTEHRSILLSYKSLRHQSPHDKAKQSSSQLLRLPSRRSHEEHFLCATRSSLWDLLSGAEEVDTGCGSVNQHGVSLTPAFTNLFGPRVP